MAACPAVSPSILTPTGPGVSIAILKLLYFHRVFATSQLTRAAELLCYGRGVAQ